MVEAAAAQFTFTVNGTEIKTGHEKLVAADILRLAAENGAIPNKAEDYQLETADGEHQFKDDDWVDFQAYKDFITVPTSRTDVAETGQ